MTDRTLTITLDAATLTALQQAGFRLYAFRPMMSSNKSGVPLVWKRLDSFLQTISLSYTSAAITAYISTDAIVVNQPVTVGTSSPVASGQIVDVVSGGKLNVTTGAPAGYIYFVNDSSTSYTCGLTAAYGTAATPCCAFNLYPSIAVTLAPLDAIFVMWATSSYDPAVYMAQSLGPGLFVQFDGNAQRAVSYDINRGWGAGGAAWATSIPANTNLAPTLILSPGNNRPLR